MKKSIMLGIVSLAAGVATAYGQGYILLDNYNSGGTLLQYGANVPANGVNGILGTVGVGLHGDVRAGLLYVDWTVGLYFVGGTTGLTQAAGSDMPDASLSLGTGIGSTADVAGPLAGSSWGYYISAPAFNSGSTANTTLTLEIVVYDSADGSYANAHYRARSAAFSMPTAAETTSSFPGTGAFMPGTLQVLPVPEPAALALGGLGVAALMLARRKKA